MPSPFAVIAGSLVDLAIGIGIAIRRSAQVCALRGSRHLGLLCHRGHDHFAAPVDRSSGPYGQNLPNHGADSRRASDP